MEYLRMNKDRARKVKAFAHKELSKYAKPGDTIINVSYSYVIKLPSDPEEFKTYCERYGRETYYVLMKPEMSRNCDILLSVQEDIEKQKNKLKELEEYEEKMKKTVRGQIMDPISSVIVCFFRKKQDEVMDPAVIKLRPEDKLLNFGIRYNNQGTCMYVGLIEVKGILNNDIRNHYGKPAYWTNNPEHLIKASQILELSKTGFKPGVEFASSMTTPII